MKTPLILFVALSAVWLVATIEPAVPLCGHHSAALYAHCWRCYALAAELVILITTTLRLKGEKT